MQKDFHALFKDYYDNPTFSVEDFVAIELRDASMGPVGRDMLYLFCNLCYLLDNSETPVINGMTVECVPGPDDLTCTFIAHEADKLVFILKMSVGGSGMYYGDLHSLDTRLTAAVFNINAPVGNNLVRIFSFTHSYGNLIDAAFKYYIYSAILGNLSRKNLTYRALKLVALTQPQSIDDTWRFFDPNLGYLQVHKLSRSYVVAGPTLAVPEEFENSDYVEFLSDYIVNCTELVGHDETVTTANLTKILVVMAQFDCNVPRFSSEAMYAILEVFQPNVYTFLRAFCEDYKFKNKESVLQKLRLACDSSYANQFCFVESDGGVTLKSFTDLS